MFAEQYILVPLTTRKNLCFECVELLNQEWPRSVGARENTLRKSLNSIPPMSFIVIDKRTDNLVGHARLCPLLAVSESCWIESVIIRSDLRGRGLGYWLMMQLEDEARKLGFRKAYLSSENKQAFYAKCGYSLCEPVLNVGANAALFERFDIGRRFLSAFDDSLFNEPIAETDSSKSSAFCSSMLPSEKNMSLPIPPPPPPPPPLPPPNRSVPSTAMPSGEALKCESKKSQFMFKVL